MLGSIWNKLKCDDNDKCFKQATGLCELTMTKWTVRTTTYMTVLTSYENLMKLWDMYLQSYLDRETRVKRIKLKRLALNSFMVWIQHIGFKQWQMISPKRFRKILFHIWWLKNHRFNVTDPKRNENTRCEVILREHCQQGNKTWIYRMPCFTQKEEKIRLYNIVEMHF